MSCKSILSSVIRSCPLVLVVPFLAGFVCDAPAVFAQETIVASGLSSPEGLSVDGNGNVYVAQSNTHSVLRFAPTSGGYTSSTVASGLNAPFDVAALRNGSFYVADEGASAVYLYSLSGGVYTKTSVAGSFSFPAGVAVDSSGDLVVTNTGNNGVLLCSGGSCAGIAGGAGLSSPSGAAIDPFGNIYIADEGNNRVIRVPAQDLSCALGDCIPVGGSLSGPASVASDSFGNIYIADTNNNRIVGAPITDLTCSLGGCINIGGFSSPLGVAVDAGCNVYVSDTNDNEVVRLQGCTSVFTGVPTATVTRGNISTIAGNGTFGFSGTPGPATQASLVGPTGIKVDAKGNVYFTDVGNQVIYKVDTSGNLTVFAGTPDNHGYTGDGGPANQAEFNGPRGLAFDAGGNMYIADSGNGVIRKVDPAGIISTVAGNGTDGFSGDGGQATNAELFTPSDVAVDGGGNFYIADETNQRIRKVDTKGNISTIAGDGTCADTGDGGAATSAELCYPLAVSLDTQGNLYIDESFTSVIRQINASGIISTVAGISHSLGYTGDGGKATSAELDQPSGAVADGAGNIYITDSINNVVRKVNTAGIITTIVGNGFDSGTGKGGFSGDGGRATQAELNAPWASALDKLGNLYVTDLNNYRVRKVTVSTNAINFPTPAAAGTTDTTDGKLSIIVANTGSGVLKAVSPGISVPENFTEVAGSGSPADCSTTFSLAPGATCKISIEFTPGGTAAIGAVSGTLMLTDNSSNASKATQVVTLTGIVAGTSSGPAASLSPTSLTFASTKVGSTSATQTVTVTNTGTATLDISGINATGTDASSFFVPSRTCGSTLAAGANCTLSIGFRPKASGTLTGSISITDNAGNSPQTIAVSGTGVASPVVKFSVGSLSFPSTDVGATSASQAVTLTNTGDATLTIAYIISKGADPSSFFDPSNTCGTSVAAGASCTINIAFRPKASGALTDTIYVNDNAAGGEQGVNVSGTGIAEPLVTLSPNNLTFPGTSVGSTSAAQTVTLTNTGFAVLDISYFSTTGTDASSFAVPSKTCGSTLAVNASCTFDVVFKPQATGALSGDVAIHDNALNSPQGLKVSGTSGIAITVATTEVNFGTVKLDSYKNVNLTINNVGNTSYSLGATISGPPFYISNGGFSCGGILAPGASCV